MLAKRLVEGVMKPAGGSDSRDPLDYPHQFFGMAHRQRPPQDSVKGAEDQRTGANANGE
jgi:hypothetical protein